MHKYRKVAQATVRWHDSNDIPKNFITCIEVSHMNKHSSKSTKLRNVNTVRKPSCGLNESLQKQRVKSGPSRTCLSLPIIFYKPFRIDTYVVVPLYYELLCTCVLRCPNRNLVISKIWLGQIGFLIWPRHTLDLVKLIISITRFWIWLMSVYPNKNSNLERQILDLA